MALERFGLSDISDLYLSEEETLQQKAARKKEALPYFAKKATISGIIDGDTYDIVEAEKNLRLAGGIDTAESVDSSKGLHSQQKAYAEKYGVPWESVSKSALKLEGLAAKKKAMGVIGDVGSEIYYADVGTGRYGRTLSKVYNPEGESVNEALDNREFNFGIDKEYNTDAQFERARNKEARPNASGYNAETGAPEAQVDSDGLFVYAGNRHLTQNDLDANKHIFDANHAYESSWRKRIGEGSLGTAADVAAKVVSGTGMVADIAEKFLVSNVKFLPGSTVNDMYSSWNDAQLTSYQGLMERMDWEDRKAQNNVRIDENAIATFDHIMRSKKELTSDQKDFLSSRVGKEMVKINQDYKAKLEAFDIIDKEASERSTIVDRRKEASVNKEFLDKYENEGVASSLLYAAKNAPHFSYKIIESLPFMAALATPTVGTITVGAMAKTGTIDGIAEFKLLNNRGPIEEEVNTIAMWKTASALFEKFGANRVFAGNAKVVKQFLKEMGTLGDPVKFLAKGVESLFSEGVSGGGSAFSDQMAVKQDLSEIDSGEVVLGAVEEALGAGGMAVGVSVSKVVGKARRDAADLNKQLSKLTTRVEKLNTRLSEESNPAQQEKINKLLLKEKTNLTNLQSKFESENDKAIVQTVLDQIKVETPQEVTDETVAEPGEYVVTSKFKKDMEEDADAPAMEHIQSSIQTLGNSGASVQERAQAVADLIYTLDHLDEAGDKQEIAKIIREGGGASIVEATKQFTDKANELKKDNIILYSGGKDIYSPQEMSSIANSKTVSPEASEAAQKVIDVQNKLKVSGSGKTVSDVHNEIVNGAPGANGFKTYMAAARKGLLDTGMSKKMETFVGHIGAKVDAIKAGAKEAIERGENAVFVKEGIDGIAAAEFLSESQLPSDVEFDSKGNAKGYLKIHKAPLSLLPIIELEYALATAYLELALEANKAALEGKKSDNQIAQIRELESKALKKFNITRKQAEQVKPVKPVKQKETDGEVKEEEVERKKETVTEEVTKEGAGSSKGKVAKTAKELDAVEFQKGIDNKEHDKDGRTPDGSGFVSPNQILIGIQRQITNSSSPLLPHEIQKLKKLASRLYSLNLTEEQIISKLYEYNSSLYGLRTSAGKRVEPSSEASNETKQPSKEDTVVAYVKSIVSDVKVGISNTIKSIANTDGKRILFNTEMLIKDFNDGLGYLTGKVDTASSKQKKVVFENIDVEHFKKFILENGIEKYIDFIIAHEQSHVKNKDASKDYDKYGINPTAIGIERRANDDAFKAIGYKPIYKEVKVESVDSIPVPVEDGSEIVTNEELDTSGDVNNQPPMEDVPTPVDEAPESFNIVDDYFDTTEMDSISGSTNTPAIVATRPLPTDKKRITIINKLKSMFNFSDDRNWSSPNPFIESKERWDSFANTNGVTYDQYAAMFSVMANRHPIIRKGRGKKQTVENVDVWRKRIHDITKRTLNIGTKNESTGLDHAATGFIEKFKNKVLGFSNHKGSILDLLTNTRKEGSASIIDGITTEWFDGSDIVDAQKGFVKDEGDLAKLKTVASIFDAIKTRLNAEITKQYASGNPTYKAHVNAFTVKGSDGRMHIADPVVFALTVASIRWFLDNAHRSLTNNEKEIAEWLYQKRDNAVSEQEAAVIGGIGLSYGFAAQAVGKNALKILGVKFKNLNKKELETEGDINLQDTLESSFGQLALSALSDMPIGKEWILESPTEQLSLGKESKSNLNGKHQRVLRAKRTVDRDGEQTLSGGVKHLLAVFTGSHKFFDRISGAELTGEGISEVPIDNKPTRVRGSFSMVPETRANVMDVLQKIAHGGIFDRLDAFHTFVNRETQKKMLGFVDESSIYKEDRSSQKSKNDNIEKDLDIQHDFWNAKKGKFWYPYKLMKQFRFMINSEDVNPLRSKHLHRSFFAPLEKRETFVKDGSPSMNLFALGISQALGKDFDKLQMEQAYLDFADVYKKYSAEGGLIEQLINLQSGNYTEAQKAKFNADLVEHGIDSKGFAGLIELAKFHKRDKKKGFKTTLSFEIDGITNGYYNVMMQFMPEDLSDNEILRRLEQVGVNTREGGHEGNLGSFVDGYIAFADTLDKTFDFIGADYLDQANAIAINFVNNFVTRKELLGREKEIADAIVKHFGKSGIHNIHPAVLETIASNAIKSKSDGVDAPVPNQIGDKGSGWVEALKVIVGAKDGKIVERALAKQPFMIFNYEAGIDKVLDEVTEEHRKKIYALLVEAAKSKDLGKIQQLEDALNALTENGGIELKGNLLEIDIPQLDEVIATLRGIYELPMQTAVLEWVKPYKGIKTSLIKALDSTVEIFINEYDQAVARASVQKAIAFKGQESKRKILSDSEKRLIAQSLLEYYPKLGGVFGGNDANGKKAFMDIVISGKGSDQARAQTATEPVGRPIDIRSGSGKTKKAFNNSVSSTSAMVSNNSFSSPGPALITNAIQNMDSGTLSLSMLRNPNSIGLHDAQYGPLNSMQKIHNDLNTISYNQNKGYSIAEDVIREVGRITFAAREQIDNRLYNELFSLSESKTLSGPELARRREKIFEVSAKLESQFGFLEAYDKFFGQFEGIGVPTELTKKRHKFTKEQFKVRTSEVHKLLGELGIEPGFASSIQATLSDIADNPKGGIGSAVPKTTYKALYEAKDLVGKNTARRRKLFRSIRPEHVNQYAMPNVSQGIIDTEKLFSLGSETNTDLNSDLQMIERIGSAVSTDIDRVNNDLKSMDDKTASPSDKDHSSTLDSLIGTLINPLMDKIGGLTLTLNETKKLANGWYDRGQNSVTVNYNRKAPVTYSEQTRQEVYAHELVHAVASRILEKNARYREKVGRMFAATKKALDEKHNGKGWKAFVDTSHGALIDPKAEIQRAKEQYDAVFTDGSLQEFLAYGLTNKTLSTQLASMEAEGVQWFTGTTWYEKVLNAMYEGIELLGRLIDGKKKSPNMYFQLLDLTQDVTGVNNNRTSQIAKFKDDKLNIDKLDNWIKEKGLNFRDAHSDKVVQFVAKAAGALPKNKLTLPLDIAMKVIATAFANGNTWSQKVDGVHRIISIPVKMKSYIDNKVLNALYQEWRSMVHKMPMGISKAITKSMHLIDQAGVQKTEEIKNQLMGAFANDGKDIDGRIGNSITEVLARTEAFVLMEKYSPEKILGFITDRDKLNDLISDEFRKLGIAPTDYWFNQIHGIAERRVLNETERASIYLNIEVSNKHSDSNVDVDVQRIRRLAALVSISKTSTTARNLAGRVMRSELDRGVEWNGMTATLTMLASARKTSEASFGDDGMLIVDGYVSQITDPHKAIMSAPVDAETKLEMKQRGYEFFHNHQVDGISSVQYGLYYAKNLPLDTQTKGLFSMQSKKHRGVSIIEMSTRKVDQQLADLRESISIQPSENKSILLKKLIKKKMQIKKDTLDDMIERQTNLPHVKTGKKALRPVTNASGRIVDYVIEMNLSDKDRFLKLNSNIFDVVAENFSSVVRKESTGKVNDDGVDVLVARKNEHYQGNEHEFIDILDSSVTDETFSRLPYEAKKKIEKLAFEGDGTFMVEEAYVDAIFGYRNWSIGNLLPERKHKLKRNIKIIEEGINGIVSIINNNIVIKNPAVWMANITSNFMTSSMSGLSMTQIFKSWREGLRELRVIQADMNALAEFDNRASVDTRFAKKNAHKRKMLVQRINNNPTKELVDVGLYSALTTQEMGTSEFSYKNQFISKIEKHLDGVKGAKGLTGIVKAAYMAEDTSAYKSILSMVQVSDFLGRYGVYNHMTKEQGKTKDEAYQYIQDVFVDFNPPVGKFFQYANSLGMILFYKYFIRIQRPIFGMMKHSPSRTMAFLGMRSLTGMDPATIFDSGILTGGNLAPAHGWLDPVNMLKELVTPSGVEFGIDVLKPIGFESDIVKGALGVGSVAGIAAMERKK